MPEDALAVRADAIIGTGQSDYPNQINNVLCFPFIFRGALLLGRPPEIEARIKQFGLRLSPGATCDIVDPQDAKIYEGAAASYYERKKRDGVSKAHALAEMRSKSTRVTANRPRPTSGEPSCSDRIALPLSSRVSWPDMTLSPRLAHVLIGAHPCHCLSSASRAAFSCFAK
jgi:hypothetical protein